MCKVLRVSKNAYYPWLRGEAKPNARRIDKLKKQIQEVFDDSNQVYGSHKVMVELGKQGVSVSRAYVARLLKGGHI